MVGSRWSGKQMAAALVLIVTVVSIFLVVVLRPLVWRDVAVASDATVLDGAGNIGSVLGDLFGHFQEGFEDGSGVALSDVLARSVVTGTSSFQPNEPVTGPMVVQFTRNGRIEGFDSLGQEQVVEGECVFQLLAGEDLEDTDVVALAEVLAGVCGGPAIGTSEYMTVTHIVTSHVTVEITSSMSVEVTPPVECVTPTVGECSCEDWPFAYLRDPCCGNEMVIVITAASELTLFEKFEGERNWRTDVWTADSWMFLTSISDVERGWDFEGPWIIVHIWTWDDDCGAWTTLEHEFRTAEMFGRISIYECEPVPESDKG